MPVGVSAVAQVTTYFFPQGLGAASVHRRTDAPNSASTKYELQSGHRGHRVSVGTACGFDYSDARTAVG
jgi:hypothetical protein